MTLEAAFVIFLVAVAVASLLMILIEGSVSAADTLEDWRE